MRFIVAIAVTLTPLVSSIALPVSPFISGLYGPGNGGRASGFAVPYNYGPHGSSAYQYQTDYDRNGRTTVDSPGYHYDHQYDDNGHTSGSGYTFFSKEAKPDATLDAKNEAK
ncbi:hypothetical protein PGT21_029113 [Puccinia graminis f. sp. tritici]|uniref:Uncharacterized protein n=1 Tax=Puccinia graminis f. sp. tritici TaxID=56615 RepID=A0A5B0QBR8_PUCGR|nr:hypothetical protein PGT21_029113 [Puccinia graminis f. sp. tritici]KAA1139274.1 hypothetical protein PGTUg99_037623 [Puccinia graminis f. sp. tritici]